MEQKRIILFFCMIFVASAAFCQFSPKVPKGNYRINEDSLITNPLFLNSFFSAEVLPANFSTTQLGFFCKKELKFESATKIPLRLRIGTVQYCDWLEGKKNTSVLPVAH